ncbi:MAG: hypothetical protein KKF27_20780 [Gammaproteobacteria bacterium]|uniref:Putative tail protein n=1 Tax=viral metagenome TaxID=1070528 RepID=A0A6M3JA22_9ZZZZ|nr:hypothetical protein [Gammaproteobacteria bacterium]MBU2685685.1 hypothetical protein [Gammaproteobacteria bacterium]
MALFDSKNSIFQINDGSSLRDISPYIVSIDGLPGPKELVDVTALGATGREWQPGLENVVITIELLWSDDASVGPDTVFRLVRALTAATAWDYGPEGKTSTYQKYSGTCWYRNFTIQTRVGDYVRARAELQVEGAVSMGAYA